MASTPILEMARVYGLRPWLWLLLHTDSLHQAIRSTGYAWPLDAPECSAVIGWLSVAETGACRSLLFRCVVPSAVRCLTFLLLWLCFLFVVIHASEISISLSLLMLLGSSRMWIASLTLRVYQWGSRSINLTALQSGLCSVFLAYSESAGVRVRASWMSRSFSLILSCIDLPVSPMYALQHSRESCKPHHLVLRARQRLSVILEVMLM